MAASDGAASALVDELIEELERLPSQPSVAMKVVWAADDPRSSAADLAAAIAADPSLTARILKVANSAYYGLSGRVANTAFAVTVIGFPTVRAMAAATASGLFQPGERVVPDGFWQHALVVASSCSKLADRVGVRGPDAFSLGLLHDLGAVLLFRTDQDRFDEVVRLSREDGLPTPVLERELFGLGHDEAAARVFATWRFPDDFVAAIAEHHRLLGRTPNPYGRLLAAAESVAARIRDVPSCDLTGLRDDGLACLGVAPGETERLVHAVEEEAADLLDAFAAFDVSG
jgi:putative nucleotidyltransferase with HDIG domain